MPKKIIVVDDSETVRKLLSLTLKTRGFTTVTASDGLEALEKMAREIVDLVITDLNMPVMDGYEFVSTLRNEGQYRSIPVIMLSTESKEEDKQKGLEVGANVYMVKPTKPAELLENIEKLLE